METNLSLFFFFLFRLNRLTDSHLKYFFLIFPEKVQLKKINADIEFVIDGKRKIIVVITNRGWD